MRSTHTLQKSAGVDVEDAIDRPIDHMASCSSCPLGPMIENTSLALNLNNQIENYSIGWLRIVFLFS
jgi:hypothetical protein